MILPDLANPHPQLIYLRATKLSRELRYIASEPPSMDFDGAMNVGLKVALLAGSCSAMTCAEKRPDRSSCAIAARVCWRRRPGHHRARVMAIASDDSGWRKLTRMLERVIDN
jgi:hypothetical protein